MKKSVQCFVAAVLAAALVAGCASAPQSPPSPGPPASTLQGKATVRSVIGAVTYATDRVFLPLKINMQLPAGTIIKADRGASAYLQVNGFTSTIKVTEVSEVELTRMDVHGAGPDADTDTLLTVKVGTILAHVRKLSANSRFEMHTPNGVAAVRGTDFQVTVEYFTIGKVQVTYTCVTGQLLVSANVNGRNVTRVLESAQSWVPGEGDVQGVPIAVMKAIGGPISFQPEPPPQPPPPVVLVQPFNGSGAPNPAVDAGQNPSKRVASLPIPGPPPPPLDNPARTAIIPNSPSPTRH
jgi:hypothetical protein